MSNSVLKRLIAFFVRRNTEHRIKSLHGDGEATITTKRGRRAYVGLVGREPDASGPLITNQHSRR